MKRDKPSRSVSSKWGGGRRNKGSRVRIIAGEWRSRRISISPRPQCRPTPAQVRETLFNWVGDAIRGTHVLDLFAGTGALGFEALSRGANHATFIERDRKTIAVLRKTCQQFELDANRAHVVEANALSWLNQNNAEWDVVFVDPPFKDRRTYDVVLRRLLSKLSRGALVYVESPVRTAPLEADLALWKNKEVGEVRMQLFANSAPMRARKTGG